MEVLIMGTENNKTNPATTSEHKSTPMPGDSKQSQQSSEKPVQMGDAAVAEAVKPAAGETK
jgi:hypothetical protein